MKFSGFCFYILALLFEGDKKEEGEYSSIRNFISTSYATLFALVKNNSSLGRIGYEKRAPEIHAVLPLNKDFPSLMSQSVEDTGFTEPEDPHHSVTTNWLSQQTLLLWRKIEIIYVEIITVFALAVILFGIFQMLKILTRYKNREEEIMLQNIETSFLKLNNSMVKASENLTTATKAFVKEKMKESDEKYSQLLTKLLEALQIHNTRSEEREAKSCYLIMKFRSARLLQYGQMNVYLESLLEHLMKQQFELNALRDDLFDIRSFIDGITTQFSESRDNAQRFIREILHAIQNSALYDQDQERNKENLRNVIYILEPIVKKTSNNNFNFKHFNGFK